MSIYVFHWLSFNSNSKNPFLTNRWLSLRVMANYTKFMIISFLFVSFNTKLFFKTYASIHLVLLQHNINFYKKSKCLIFFDNTLKPSVSFSCTIVLKNTYRINFHIVLRKSDVINWRKWIRYVLCIYYFICIFLISCFYSISF